MVPAVEPVVPISCDIMPVSVLITEGITTLPAVVETPEEEATTALQSVPKPSRESANWASELNPPVPLLITTWLAVPFAIPALGTLVNPAPDPVKLVAVTVPPETIDPATPAPPAVCKDPVDVLVPSMVLVKRSVCK
jgi:hypothetical protein